MEENTKMGNYSWAILTTVVVIGGYLLYSQYRPASNEMPAPTSTSTQTEVASNTPSVSTESAPMNTEGKVVEIEAGSFYYKPNVIEVKRGEKVKITMKSVDMMHDFVIDELGVKMPIVKSGNMGEVEFTADQVGEFEFYCSVGQHRANGQVGTLKVTE